MTENHGQGYGIFLPRKMRTLGNMSHMSLPIKKFDFVMKVKYQYCTTITELTHQKKTILINYQRYKENLV